MTGIPQSGRWLITTESSTHLLDLDAMTIVRTPDAGSGAIDGTGTPPKAASLRRDTEPVDVLSVERITLGSRARLWLDVRRDGVPTLRTTTIVTSIDPAPEVTP